MSYAARIPTPNTTLRNTLCMLALLLAAPAQATADATLLGPTPYTSRADSPFETTAFGFCVEDFEDGFGLDIPGAALRPGVGGGSLGLTDSVDADDGTIDGSGSTGRSMLYVSDGLTSPAALVIDFDPDRTHGLPTEVGIVWTDGGASAGVTFAAYGPDGQLLVGPNGPNAHADASNDGETAEDRFYGVTNPAGVSRIDIGTTDPTEAGLEVDHIQLNRCILCGDTDSDLNVDVDDVLSLLRTSIGMASCLPCLCDINNDGRTSATDAWQLLRIAIGNAAPTFCPACEGL